VSPGDIVLVRFPFTSLETDKKRPALVVTATSLGRRVELVTVAMITSKVDGVRLAGDTQLVGWKSAHLLHPSLVRLAKMATLDRALVERRLGALSDADVASVRRSFARMFRFWTE
jgi:mRNA-degrading endonuclease toxin of MazEF toxin-antitoxin module